MSSVEWYVSAWLCPVSVGGFPDPILFFCIVQEGKVVQFKSSNWQEPTTFCLIVLMSYIYFRSYF